MQKHKYVVDFSRPANDGVFDGAAFEKFLHDRIKVDGRPGQLGDSVKIQRDGNKSLTVSANVDLSKRYVKYLTKKYLKKNQLRDWIRYGLGRDAYVNCLIGLSELLLQPKTSMN